MYNSQPLYHLPKASRYRSSPSYDAALLEDSWLTLGRCHCTWATLGLVESITSVIMFEIINSVSMDGNRPGWFGHTCTLCLRSLSVFIWFYKRSNFFLKARSASGLLYIDIFKSHMYNWIIHNEDNYDNGDDDDDNDESRNGVRVIWTLHFLWQGFGV